MLVHVQNVYGCISHVGWVEWLGFTFTASARFQPRRATTIRPYRETRALAWRCVLCEVLWWWLYDDPYRAELWMWWWRALSCAKWNRWIVVVAHLLVKLITLNPYWYLRIYIRIALYLCICSMFFLMPIVQLNHHDVAWLSKTYTDKYKHSLSRSPSFSRILLWTYSQHLYTIYNTEHDDDDENSPRARRKYFAVNRASCARSNLHRYGTVNMRVMHAANHQTHIWVRHTARRGHD